MNIEYNVFTPDDITISENELTRLLASFGEDFGEELRELAVDAAAIAAPKALWCAVRVEEVRPDGVTIGGFSFKSSLMAKNFASTGRVFPYICTCGTGLADWSASLNDPFAEYFADELMKLYLGKAIVSLRSYLRKRFAIEGHFTAMNPGSLPDWPITSQHELFDLFDRQRVLELIGVRLTESCLMLPSKSSDGIYFSSADGFESCQLCPLDDCPNRRKPRIKQELDASAL